MSPTDRDRKVRDTDKKTYVWEQAPRQLLDDAMRKGRLLDPPQTLKAILTRLLKGWTYGKRASRDPF